MRPYNREDYEDFGPYWFAETEEERNQIREALEQAQRPAICAKCGKPANINFFDTLLCWDCAGAPLKMLDL